LDEPDSFLHPQRQRELFPHLKGLFSESYTQIIATTHSPFVAQSVPFENIILFNKDGKLIDKKEVVLDTEAINSVLFNVPERFNDSIMEKLKEFDNYRDSIFRGEEINLEAMRLNVEELQKLGEETRVIIARELSRLKRLKGFDINGKS
jgi:predicted ATP-binding protein involved in virulence